MKKFGIVVLVAGVMACLFFFQKQIIVLLNPQIRVVSQGNVPILVCH
jgi:hypothetical protein